MNDLKALVDVLEWLRKYHNVTLFFGSVIKDGKEIISVTYKA